MQFYFFLILLLLLLLFWLYYMACGILFPQAGIETMLLAVKAWSPNPWIAREVPEMQF